MATTTEREDAATQRANQLSTMINNEQPGQAEMLEANALVNGDRQASYGPPRESYEAQAKVWSGMMAHKLKTDFTAEDIVLLLCAMKLRREALKPKRDNRVDVHGYMLVLDHVVATAPK